MWWTYQPDVPFMQLPKTRLLPSGRRIAITRMLSSLEITFRDSEHSFVMWESVECHSPVSSKGMDSQELVCSADGLYKFEKSLRVKSSAGRLAKPASQIKKQQTQCRAGLDKECIRTSSVSLL
jgi:hypothetical protein